MRSNPNSKRGQVRAALKHSGEEEALRIGLQLNIPEAKVRRWIRKFSAVQTSPQSKRGEVTSPYWPDQTGYIEEQGDDVSGVRFRDGSYHFIPNERIHKVETGK